jgi:hypothetical protein
MSRRALLETAAAGAAGWVLSACAPPETRSGATSPPAPTTIASAKPSISASPGPAASAAPAASPSTQALGYVFNTTGQDVTIFDVTTRQVVGTKALGTAVTWLSNEQRFWDGQHIWTFDYPQNLVRAIAIDPSAVTVARTIPTGGKGPAHSLMLTPDRRTAWVNVAGEDFLAVLDVGSGQMVAQVKTGKFP